MTKLPNSVLAFAAGNEDRKAGYEQFVEYYDFYKTGKKVNENGTKLSEMDSKMLQFFTDEIEQLSGRKLSEVNSDLAKYCAFTAVREAAFAVVGMLADLVIPDALIKDFGMIADVKSGAWGDSFTVKLQPRDLLVVSKGGRARKNPEITRQYKGEKTILPEPRAISIGVSLYDILRGAASLADFMAKAIQSLQAQMRYDIYDAFATAMAALPSSGDGQLLISGYTQADAIGLAQKVQAWNGGNPAIFLGTKLALSNILPASTGTRISLGDEYVRIGHLREFFGFDCVELEQVADYTTEFKVKLDDTKIYVVSPGVDKLMKVFIEGGTLTNVEGTYENANLQQVATIFISYGVAACSSAIAGVIELS